MGRGEGCRIRFLIVRPFPCFQVQWSSGVATKGSKKVTGVIATATRGQILLLSIGRMFSGLNVQIFLIEYWGFDDNDGNCSCTV